MLRTFIRQIIFTVAAFSLAAPATQAVELNLGGFPSYMSTRARYIQSATYRHALDNEKDDAIFFADTTLRLTPQLVLSDSVTIRTQIDIFDNNILGGSTDQLLGGGSTVVNSSISPSDKFRGTLLHGNAKDNCLSFGRHCAVEEDAGFFNVRMLHADILLPNNLGFVRIGRQPFDWGLGILANGGWDPNSDGGFLVDRFLWLKTFATGSNTNVTAIFVSDRITQGTGPLHTESGDGWDGGAVAFLVNHTGMGNVDATVGGYIFPYIHQDGFVGDFGDLDRYTLYSGLVDIKVSSWRFAGEFQAGFGRIEDALDPATGKRSDSKLKNAFLFAVRAEYKPELEYLNMFGAEFGWADGDKNNGKKWNAGESIEGGVIVFNPAYNLDNLLFKHVMPSIYQDAHPNIIARSEASVQNAYYARLYANISVSERVAFRPQILVAWNNETEGLIKDGAVIGTLPPGTLLPPNGKREDFVARQPKSKASSYLGTEIEGTVAVEIHPGVNLDIIGSIIVAGEGLTDLLEAQAFARDNGTAGTTEFDGTAAANRAVVRGQKADNIIWGVQTKLTILIDEFFKSEDV